MSTEVRDSLVEVGWLHIGNGGEGVSTLYGFPLRRIDADFTLEQAEQVMQNATMLSDAGQGIPVKAYHRNMRGGSPLTGLPRDVRQGVGSGAWHANESTVVTVSAEILD